MIRAAVPLLLACAAAAEDGGALSLAARLGAGGDGEPVLVPDEDPVGGEAGGIALGGSLGATWHALREPGTRLDLGTGGEWTTLVGDGAPRRLERIGASATGTLEVDGRMPGLTLSVDRWALDERGVATAGGAAASLAIPAQSWLAWPALEARWLGWDDGDDRDGLLLAARYRHWFLLAPDDASRRIELGLRAGRFLAEADHESYVSARGEAGVRWRTAPRADGGWEWGFRAWGEWRGFDERAPGVDEVERQALGGAQAECDRWLTGWLAAGVYAAATVRVDTLDDEGYERWQAGLRLTASR